MRPEAVTVRRLLHKRMAGLLPVFEGHHCGNRVRESEFRKRPGSPAPIARIMDAMRNGFIG